jgi:biopolymer transport protein ExbD
VTGTGTARALKKLENTCRSIKKNEPMALRKRTKHIAEVNMSSMTDIIFMLLIFFMLTSTLVKMIDYELPTSNSRAPAPMKVDIKVKKDGTMRVNDTDVTEETLEKVLKEEIAKKTRQPEKATVAILPEVGCTTEQWAYAMTIANKVKAKAVMGTQPQQ